MVAAKTMQQAQIETPGKWHKHGCQTLSKGEPNHLENTMGDEKMQSAAAPNTFKEEQKSSCSGDFSLQAVLGSGAFGTVVLGVKDEALVNGANIDRIIAKQAAMAFKLVKKKDIDDKEFTRNSTFRELQVLSKCKHPFIVKCYGSSYTQQNFVFHLEYLPGGELLTLMIQKVDGFDYNELRFYAAEIATALDYLHCENIIYRDLKPENIALGADGHIRLIDFGLAVELDPMTVLNRGTGRLEIVSHAGTLGYAAPEILKREPHSFEIDWWALGVLLFEMYYSRLPWMANDDQTTCNLICSHHLQCPKPRQSVEEILTFDLISQLLTKTPTERLGYHKGLAELKQHSFFQGIDWDLVTKKGLPAPWTPSLSGVCDVRYFCEEYTGMSLFDIDL